MSLKFPRQKCLLRKFRPRNSISQFSFLFFFCPFGGKGRNVIGHSKVKTSFLPRKKVGNGRFCSEYITIYFRQFFKRKSFVAYFVFQRMSAVGFPIWTETNIDRPKFKLRRGKKDVGISFRLWGNLRLGCKHYLPPPQYCVTFKFPHIVKRKMSLPEVFFPWFVGGSDIIRRPNIFFQFARASFSHSVLSPFYHANN